MECFNHKIPPLLPEPYFLSLELCTVIPRFVFFWAAPCTLQTQKPGLVILLAIIMSVMWPSKASGADAAESEHDPSPLSNSHK